jgi:hypothetical protein
MNTKTISEVFIENEIKQHRILAVQRFTTGESLSSICYHSASYVNQLSVVDVVAQKIVIDILALST